VSSGYIYFYFAENIVPEIAAIEKRLKSIGLHLEQPGTHRVFSISSNGDQIIVSRSWIETQIASFLPVSIQWWHTDAEDVYCRFRPRELQNQWCLEFGFDGVGAEQREALIATASKFFVESCARSEAEALVVDSMGILEETDWDAVISGHARPEGVPDILVLPLRLIRNSGMAHKKFVKCSSHVIVTSTSPELPQEAYDEE
jgi:hypothetical protein